MRLHETGDLRAAGRAARLAARDRVLAIGAFEVRGLFGVVERTEIIFEHRHLLYTNRY